MNRSQLAVWVRRKAHDKWHRFQSYPSKEDTLGQLIWIKATHCGCARIHERWIQLAVDPPVEDRCKRCAKIEQ